MDENRKSPILRPNVFLTIFKRELATLEAQGGNPMTLSARSLIRAFKEVRQTKSIYQRVRDYRGFFSIKYESDDFVVRNAQDGNDLFKVLELRHEVFLKEWQGRKAFHGLDVDEYDFAADHLLIIDKKINEVVGTYRLISSRWAQNFYSASEFELEDFLRLPGVKLEMGRACIRHDYRNGNTIDLLWKGLARYCFANNADYLFGCASLKTEDPALVSRVFKTLRENEQWSDDYRIRPTWDYQYPNFSMNGSDPLTPNEKREYIPPLLRSYLHAGAKVYGWPAWDRDFACTDLLTILDWKHLNPKFQSRFLKD